MITWSPWKPVATKKVEPYTLSAIVNGESMYSHACKIVKYTPNETVKNSACIASVRFPARILWWDHVIVTPDERSTAVFNRGTRKGLRGVIPVGGHVTPISTDGASLL